MFARNLTHLRSHISVLCRGSVTASTSASATTPKTAVVCTTGFSFTKNGKNISKYGVFWGKNDDSNTIVESEDDRTHVANKIRAVIRAIEQAYRQNIESLTIKSDLNFTLDTIRWWYKREFITTKGGIVPNADLLKKLWELIAEADFEVNLQYDAELFGDKKNAVMRNLYTTSKKWKEASGIQEAAVVKPAAEPSTNVKKPSTRTESATSSKGTVQSVKAKGKGKGKVGRPKSALPTMHPPDLKTPTVFVVGRTETEENGFKRGACGLCWNTLETSAHRIQVKYLTPMRMTMQGIIQALNQAHSRQLKTLTIVLENVDFITHWNSDWERRDGKLVANFHFYQEIKELTKDLDVRFVCDPPADGAHEEHWTKAQGAAADGLQYPLVMTAPSPIKNAEEIVSEQVNGHIEKGMFRVRFFRSTESFSGGVFFDRVDEKSLEELNEKWYSEIHSDEVKKFPKKVKKFLDMVLSEGVEKIVVRTDHRRLIETLDCFLKVWEAGGWKTVRRQPVKNEELWRDVLENRRKIRIIWDLVSRPEPTTDGEAVMYIKKKWDKASR